MAELLSNPFIAWGVAIVWGTVAFLGLVALPVELERE